LRLVPQAGEVGAERRAAEFIQCRIQRAIRGCGEDFVTDAAILPTLENVFLTVTGHSIRD